MPKHQHLAYLTALLNLVIAVACGSPANEFSGADSGTAVSSRPPMVDRALELGLDFTHWNGMIGELYPVEALGSGAALFDYDGDGDLDIYLVQGNLLGPEADPKLAVLPPPGELPLGDRLFRNELAESGALRFTEVTEEAGLEATGYGMGVAVGDVDGDGHLDLYLTNLGADQLWHNRGDGSFEDWTLHSRVAVDGLSTAASLFDMEGDGDLDLYVGRYIDWSYALHQLCFQPSSALDYCGPESFRAAADLLWRNRGNGIFEDWTAEAGLQTAYGKALAVSAGDFDGDHHPDLMVANDAMENQLWIGRGDATFADQGVERGIAHNGAAEREASMGIAIGDVDGDGDQDVLLAHLSTETNTLYSNDGSGYFQDTTRSAGLAAPSLPFTSFGTAFFDLDNDGWLDLFTVSGAVRIDPTQQQAGAIYPLAQTNQLFHNVGDGRFEDWTATAGEVWRLAEVSRGAAIGDLDNDGDSDILLVNSNGPARLLINQIGQDRPWLGLRLVDRSGGDALGARAEVHRQGVAPLVRVVRTDGSYLSASDPRLLFGLGDQPVIDRLRVVWADGQAETFPPPSIGRYHQLQRGQGATSKD